MLDILASLLLSVPGPRKRGKVLTVVISVIVLVAVVIAVIRNASF